MRTIRRKERTMKKKGKAVRKETKGERFKSCIDAVSNSYWFYIGAMMLAGLITAFLIVGCAPSSLVNNEPEVQMKIITGLELKQDTSGKLKDSLIIGRLSGEISTDDVYCFYIKLPEGKKFQKLSADRVLIKQSYDANTYIEGFFTTEGVCYEHNLEYTIYIPDDTDLLYSE